MKKAVLFVRVSTEKQTLESQIAALKRTASIDGYGDNDIIVIAKKESGVKLKEAEREWTEISHWAKRRVLRLYLWAFTLVSWPHDFVFCKRQDFQKQQSPAEMPEALFLALGGTG